MARPGSTPAASADPARQLLECDEVRVHVLVDNTSDILSTGPRSMTPHVSNLVRRKPGLRLTGNCLCCANWGLALAIDITRGGQTRRLLFDAGPDRPTLKRNAAHLGYDLTGLDAVILSHGHWDHAGGLVEPFVQYNRARGAKGAPEFHANRGMFVRRGMRLPGGDVIPFRDPPSPDRLRQLGARLHLDDQARLLAGGVAYLSGEVPRVTPYEVGLPGHVAQTRAGAEWRDDPLILDERWLAVHLRGKGIVVFSACSHAGIVNVLRHARAAFEDAPLFAVMGGLHLSGALNEKIIPETVRDMAAFRLERILSGHCTGWRALNALSQAFGERVTPIAVGQTHEFEGMREALQ